MNKNLRENKTRKLLREALESLLEVKSLESITVKEICEKININRVTFYDYYFDKEELHDEITSEVENEIIKEFIKDNSIYYLKNYKKMLEKLINYFDDKRKHFNICLSNSKNRLLFASVLHRYFMKYLRKGIKIDNKANKIEIDNQILIKSQFISGALIYSFSWWIQDGIDISKEEFFKYICNLLDNLFENKL